MTIVIGLLGPAGAGKSSVAGHLEEKYGAVRYSLAAPLKEIAMRAFGFTHEQCWGTQAQKEAPDERYGGHSARWFLQRLGTEGIRHVFGADVWTDLLIKKIGDERPNVAVIDDVRFINEAKKLREFGIGMVHGNHFQMDRSGYIWRLESPGRETQADASHASEAEWSHAPWDYAIAPTERGLDKLFALVDDACRHYKIFPKLAQVAY